MGAGSLRSSPWLDSTEAALNAVLGDYLEMRASRLATEMAFYHRGSPLSLSAAALDEANPDCSPRIVILVHGMAQTEACWSFPHDAALSYGSLLRDDFGLSPFYLRYNTGRRIAHNGRDLAVLLEKLIDALPVSVADITLIGHSLGGLVIRSACHYAGQLGLTWIRRTHRAFYLGSPHLGTTLEKGGRLVSVALGTINHPVVRLIHSVANLRSAGVKDLGDGTLLDEDGPSVTFEDVGHESPRWVPLRKDMDHYLVAGTLTQRENHLVSRLLGDSMVRVPSATALGREAGLPSANTAVVPGVHHMMLAHCPEVYERIRDWLAAGVGSRTLPRPPALAPAVLGPATILAPGRPILERFDAYRELLQDGVDRGATAIQDVQEELTTRPYQLLEDISPLKLPTGIVRSLHLAAIRTTYDSIRLINRVAATVSQHSFLWLTRRTTS